LNRYDETICAFEPTTSIHLEILTSRRRLGEIHISDPQFKQSTNPPTPPIRSNFNPNHFASIHLCYSLMKPTFLFSDSQSCFPSFSRRVVHGIPTTSSLHVFNSSFFLPSSFPPFSPCFAFSPSVTRMSLISRERFALITYLLYMGNGRASERVFRFSFQPLPLSFRSGRARLQGLPRKGLRIVLR